MARISSTLRCQCVLIPSAAASGAPMCKWGSRRSAAARKAPPARKPTAAGSQAGSPLYSASSMAGASSDQKLAASITPAAKPIIASSSLRLTVWVRKTTAAPRAVMPQVKPEASKA